MTTIASWNVNSIRPRLEHLQQWLELRKPDVALLQEIKTVTEQFPFEAIEELGYNVAAHGQKSYNGVAILSKGPIEDITTTLPGDASDEQARYIEGGTTIDGQYYRIASVYVPNGQATDSPKFPYKLSFFNRLKTHLQQQLKDDTPLICGGDYNVAPHPNDVFDAKALDGSICYHPDERRAFYGIEHLGLTDAFHACYPDKTQFSFWDYRGGAWQGNKGYRIDHLLLSPEATDQLTDAGIDQEVRGWQKGSDHAPVWCTLS